MAHSPTEASDTGGRIVPILPNGRFCSNAGRKCWHRSGTATILGLLVWLTVFGTSRPAQAQEGRVTSEPRAVSNRLKDLATGSAKSVEAMPVEPPAAVPTAAPTEKLRPSAPNGEGIGRTPEKTSPEPEEAAPQVASQPKRDASRWATKPAKPEVNDQPRAVSSRLKDLAKGQPNSAPQPQQTPPPAPQTPPATPAPADAPPTMVGALEPKAKAKPERGILAGRRNESPTGSPLGVGNGSHASKAHSQVPLFTLDSPQPSEVDTYVDTYVPSVVPSAAATGSMENGVFPTYQEKMLMGGEGGRSGDYMRSSGGGIGGPDSIYQSSSGIFPYDSTYGGVYSQHPEIFRPINRTLGFFGPNQALSIEGQRFQNSSVSFDGNLLPFFTRTYEPDRAHVRFGPFAADLLYIGAGALYSDFNGPQKFPEGREDGLISFIDLGVRAVAQLTDQFYLALGTSLIYLPETNQLGFMISNNSGPGLSLIMDHHDTINGWDYRVFDQLAGGFLASAYFENFDNDAWVASGRYAFGINGQLNDRGVNSLFDDQSIFFSNVVGANLSGMITPSWRSTFTARHTDFWRTFDFDNAGSRDQLSALIGYEGAVLPLAPFFSYDLSSNDGFDSLFNRSAVGLRGVLAENLSLQASTGLLWTTEMPVDTQSSLWRINLTHDLSERTVHSVGFGRDFFTNEFVDEFALASFVNYRISHRVTNQLYGAAFAQHSKAEPLQTSISETAFDTFGVRLSYRPLNYTEVFATSAWQQSSFSPQDVERDRSVYQVGINQRILSRLTAGLLAQYEETDFFDEYLYRLTIRRYF
jgi:hypothetical protein